MQLDSKRTTLLIGLGVFAVALALRLVGIGWGAPNDIRNHSLHPDEQVITLYSQQIDPTRLDFTPGFYNYGTLYLTSVRIAGDLALTYGGEIAGEGPAAVNAAFARIQMAGRVISAIAGAATAWFVFLILAGRVNLLGAILGSLAMAFAPGHVMHSRFQTPDVFATFLLVVSLYFALRLLPVQEEESIQSRLFVRYGVLAGVFAGLSAGAKYTGILALIALAVACALSTDKVRWKTLALGAGAALVTFVVTTPGVLLESQRFFADFRYEMLHTSTGHGLVFAGTPSGFIFHLQNLSVAFGFVLLLVGAFGLGRAVFRRHAWAIALVAFALAYYILIGRAEVKFVRYVFPLIPVLCIGVGWLAGRAHISPSQPIKHGVVFLAILGVGGVGGGGLTLAVNTTILMTQEDVRDAFAREIMELLEDGESVGFVSDPWFYSIPLFPDSAAMRPFDPRESSMFSDSKNPLLLYVPDNPDERFSWDVRLLTELEPTYVVYSSFEFADLARLMKEPSPPTEYKIQIERAKEFMDILSTHYEPLEVRGDDAVSSFTFPDGTTLHDLMYVRPTLWLWKRKTDLPSESSGSSTTSEPSEEPASTP
ncbi:MAG: glycosyltransferase family 39 protein [Armatimonadetes bacterium]|nr:glycosyltransferase family 39 protein [Armatimonadota bacterium]